MDAYEASKTCKKCGNEYLIKLNKEEAAFDALSSTKVKTAKCPKCGSHEYKNASVHPPQIDKHLMSLWAKDENLYFMQQDEDLLLADKEYIHLISQFIDSNDILVSKRNILLCALCVIIYDKEDKNTCRQAKEILLSHKHLLDEASVYIYDYIGKKVFPELGLKWKKLPAKTIKDEN